MHNWGDNWPHWDELYEAEHFISGYVYKWSRCRLILKEKWGTLRYEWLFPPGCSVRLGFRIPLPWKHRNKYAEGGRMRSYWYWSDSYLIRLWRRYGKWTFKRAVHKAVKKFPNCRDEILADFNEEYI